MATGMNEYPRAVAPEALAPRLRTLIIALTERLLDGPTSTHAILREQFARAWITRVTLTGAGLFADFECPDDVPLTEQADLIGGDVPITVEGLAAGAGCLVAVRDGRLAFLEIYAYGEESWPEDAHVLSLGDPVPLPVDEP